MNTNINTSTNYYDIIIIGSGIAGLYSALNIKQMSPDTSFMVLEKYKKKWLGGRLNNEEFYGTTVVTGAGIGRKGKDYLLVELLEKLNFKFVKEAEYTSYVILTSQQCCYYRGLMAELINNID